MALFLTHLPWRDLLRLIRWPNLTLVLVCLLAFHRVLLRICPPASSCLTLKGADLALFVLVAMIITASGYVINDLKDFQTDGINRPERTLVMHQVPPSSVWPWYITLVVVGFILAALIAWRTDQWMWLPLYPLITGGLYSYATWWKGIPLWGNFLVALLTALLPLTLLLPEREWLSQLPAETFHDTMKIFIGFAFLSLSTSFYREWIKDMEDIRGDREAGWMTWAVIHGLDRARSLAVCWGILSILTLLAGVFLWTGHLWSQLLLGAAAMLQSCMLILLFRPDYPAHLRQISQSAKWTLAMGLVAVISL